EMFNTSLEAPGWARRLGCPKELHAVFFQHRNDPGGSCDSVCVEVPEGMSFFRQAMEVARERRARVLLMCNTRNQADAVARLVSNSLKDHRRVSIERARSGVWATN